MINITSKDLCCGCSACVNICPKKCISFKEDCEGFLYPSVDVAVCVDCGLCEKVCPVINKNDERVPIHTYAVKHPDEKIRLSSSSGGLFTYLAERVIDDGGVVFGARFNDQWEVVHDYTDTKEGLTPFRGSKYVQSYIGESYVLAETFLKSGRTVMFTGTPCQIAGLKKYLRKEYDNLLTVDVVCHGVPSPMVWRKYLEELTCREGAFTVTSINFRDKSTGWKNYSVTINLLREHASKRQNIVSSSRFSENEHMRAFLLNLSLRPSCYNCPAKAGRSGADITIGDFWGIDRVMPEIDDDKGTTLALVYNEDNFMTTNVFLCDISYEDALRHNKCIAFSVNESVNRGIFFKLFRYNNLNRSLKNVLSSGLVHRIKRVVYRKIIMLFK